MAAMYYGAAAVLVGPGLDGDGVRDFFAALDIARHGALPLVGPAVAGSDFHLGSAYYYLLAVPLIVWDDPDAVAWWVALWQTATVLVLFDTARRFFSHRAAFAALVLFLLSDVCFRLTDVLTHSDLSPLLGLLVVRALGRVQDGRSWAIVAAAFWCSLALHFHALNLLLFPVILLFLWIAKPPIAVDHLVVAAFAALLPFLPALWQPMSLSEVLECASGAIPIAVVTKIAWRRPALRSAEAVLLAAALAVWLFLVIVADVGAQRGVAAFRLFNVTIPLDPWYWLGATTHGRRDFGFAAPPPAQLLVWLLAVGGMAACLCEPLYRAWRGDPAARRSRSLLLVLWVVPMTAGVLATQVVAPGERRYLSHAWVPLILCAGLGVDALWRRQRERLLIGPLRLPLRALAVVGLLWMLSGLVATLVFEALRPTSYAGAERILSALRREAGLTDEELLRRVHGVISDRAAFLDGANATSFLFQFPEPEQLDARENGVEYLLVPASDPIPAGVPQIDLGVSDLRAVAFRPALRTVEATTTPPPPADMRLSLPHRLFTAPPGASDGGLATGVYLPWQPEEALRFEIPRDVPRDPRLAGIEVLAAETFGRYPPDCDVTVRLDGEPVRLRSRQGKDAVRWRFELPPRGQRSSVEVTLAGCRLGYLDIYDVYIDADEA